MVPSIKPPNAISVTDSTTTDITMATGDIAPLNSQIGATCPDTQQRYPFAKKDREKEVRTSAQTLAEIMTGENQLTVPDRVPSLISATDK